jgi:Holliday junction resolvase RusA-like endonuclease
MKFTIPGVPIPKARHRTARRGNFVMQYDPQEAEKKRVSLILLHQVSNKNTS